jgi:hypothetical protein
LCVCESPLPRPSTFEFSTNLYETWYVYHGNCALLNGYFINPSHQCVPQYMYPLIVARRQLGKKIYCGNGYTAQQQKN